MMFSIFSTKRCVFAQDNDPFLAKRQTMVEKQLAKRDIKNTRVLAAMQKVERHLFVPADLQKYAYEDYPLSIGYGQTISQPYIVAYMTQAAHLNNTDKVLEIGTGSGYQAAILAEIANAVYSIELIDELTKLTEMRLHALGYKNIFVKQSDGYQGWAEHAPFDVIIVTAAPESIVQKLVDQLKIGGRMVIPIGSFFQELYLITKKGDGVTKERLLPVQFVPMVKPIK